MAEGWRFLIRRHAATACVAAATLAAGLAPGGCGVSPPRASAPTVVAVEPPRREGWVWQYASAASVSTLEEQAALRWFEVDAWGRFDVGADRRAIAFYDAGIRTSLVVVVQAATIGREAPAALAAPGRTAEASAWLLVHASGGEVSEARVRADWAGLLNRAYGGRAGEVPDDRALPLHGRLRVSGQGGRIDAVAFVGRLHTDRPLPTGGREWTMRADLVSAAQDDAAVRGRVDVDVKIGPGAFDDPLSLRARLNLSSWESRLTALLEMKLAAVRQAWVFDGPIEGRWRRDPAAAQPSRPLAWPLLRDPL
ncbi:MAG: hypothetical protein GX591_15900 [Planctomycetes bacterium]|nr:hypothetical protein [Planctomycetota bacterium]